MLPLLLLMCSAVQVVGLEVTVMAVAVAWAAVAAVVVAGTVLSLVRFSAHQQLWITQIGQACTFGFVITVPFLLQALGCCCLGFVKYHFVICCSVRFPMVTSALELAGTAANHTL